MSLEPPAAPIDLEKGGGGSNIPGLEIALGGRVFEFSQISFASKS
jgi:hypothetical protein